MTDLWRQPGADPILREGDVHIWRASLNQPASQVQSLLQTLTADEQQRAVHYHFERDRRRFIVGRGLLRAILGRYVHAHPSLQRFRSNPYGKLALDIHADQEMLEFNLSHSSDLVLYAISRGRRVGIDLERIRPLSDVESIARRSFSPREYAVLHGLPESVKLEAFFTCWTRKEAYIKARGEGLSLPLDGFDVTLIPGEPAALLNTREDPQEVFHWSLHALPLGYTYVATLAVEGHSSHLSYLWWPAKG